MRTITERQLHLKLCDVNNDCDTAIVKLTVTHPVNDLPVAVVDYKTRRKTRL